MNGLMVDSVPLISYRTKELATLLIVHVHRYGAASAR